MTKEIKYAVINSFINWFIFDDDSYNKRRASNMTSYEEITLVEALCEAYCDDEIINRNNSLIMRKNQILQKNISDEILRTLDVRIFPQLEMFLNRIHKYIAAHKICGQIKPPLEECEIIACFVRDISDHKMMKQLRSYWRIIDINNTDNIMRTFLYRGRPYFVNCVLYLTYCDDNETKETFAHTSTTGDWMLGIEVMYDNSGNNIITVSHYDNFIGVDIIATHEILMTH